MEKDLKQLSEIRQQWEEKTVRSALSRFSYIKKVPTKFYAPDSLGEFNFLEKVGFPGEYPFTSGAYPFRPNAALEKFVGESETSRFKRGSSGQTRAAEYSGYGSPESTGNYYKNMIAMGSQGGPNLACDLPTQLGYDSDNPAIAGEVGKVGVCIDTLRDFEIIYEPFQGDLNLDKIATAWTINAPANVFIAMYLALAKKRGIPFDKLKFTPQNDILKEYVARGTYIFPPENALRLFRDSLAFLAKNAPRANILSGGGYHMREAGATREQDLAYSMANIATYCQIGIDAGLGIDEFAPQFTINAFGGDMEFLKEIAFARASRRMYATMMKERFGAKKQKSMMIRQARGAHMGRCNTTVQRPLNNLSRSVIGAIASGLSGGPPSAFPPFDEPLGLGWSLEARQLSEDAQRILITEAKILEVEDPFAGSYYMESLTNEIEDNAWEGFEKIFAMGGVVAAIESGYIKSEIAKSAYERQKRIESGKEYIVGVNCFTGEHELDVRIQTLVQNPYDPSERESAEELQKKNLKTVKRLRHNKGVKNSLEELRKAAMNMTVNTIPPLIKCAEEYVTLQEMCDVLREVFGTYEDVSGF
jgi:methylmalonyl-CoA mutase N-terminal domain/subunit